MSRPEKSPGLGCLILFAFPFAGVGLIVLAMTIWTVSDWWRMQGWIEVPARLSEVRLESNRGEDSTTYLAVAKYVYTYQGQEYVGDRVAIGTTADNIGDYHQRLVDELQRSLRRHETVPCFVDPSSPDRSVLYRDLRVMKLAFTTLFAAIFGGAGCAVIVGGIVAQRRRRREQTLEQQYPDEPWMCRDDWARGQVQSSTKATAITVVLFAAIWNLISAPALFCVPAEIGKQNYLALLALVFPLVGVGLASWAVVTVRRWMRYGTSMLQMGSVPGIVGGPLVGVIHTNINLTPQDGFHQTLSCVRRIVTGSGKNRSTRDVVIWQTTRVMQHEFAADDATKSAIPVQFHIPYTAEPTSTQDRISWRLEVRADVSGIDYHATFEVPVFRTDESSPEYQPDETAIAPFVRQDSIADVYRQCAVERHERIDGVEIRFPLFRHAGMAISTAAFLTAWVGAIVLMLYCDVPLLFPIAFGLFGLLIGYIAIELWLWRSTMRIDSRQVVLQAGIVGLTQVSTLSIDDISAVTLNAGMQAGQKLYYDLYLSSSDGKQYCFGKRVVGQAAAEAIANDVRQALGLDTSEHQLQSTDAETELVQLS